MKITAVSAFQIFDSRGQPTVEAVVELENGASGSGLVPSGASTGRHEALELRDGDPTRFGGKSVLRAVGHVNGEIARAVAGRDVLDQEGLDRAMIELDGTPDKSRLGANAILAVSMAAARAAAAARGVPLYRSLGEGTLLPLPEIQIFGGGRHAAGRVDLQDFMVIAVGAASYEAALEMTSAIHRAAGEILARRGLLAGVADEGGYWPAFRSNEEVIAALAEAISLAGYAPGRDAAISLDVAASELYRDGHYELGLERRRLEPAEFAALVAGWVRDYPVISVEDPLAEDDWEGWSRLRAEIGGRCQLVGDDLFTTSLERIERGIAVRAANAVLIKPNQAGTVTETLRALHRVREAGWLPVVSARSGETEDAFIAHLAVATDAGQLKVGSFCRGERTAKWNEVLRIARHLGGKARFEGARLFARAGICPA